MLNRLLYRISLFFVRNPKTLSRIILGIALSTLLVFIAGKTYQHWDQDPNRGAIAIKDGAFGESYSTPVYLDQGWSESDSLWFYNTTQGSGLLPYDFFLSLEQADSTALLRDNHNMDKYRYLPQKPTFFNPDGLPVGMTKDTYQGKDYMGYTCAACHTGQVNFQGTAIRIDGAPAMANMPDFLKALEKSMIAAQSGEKNSRFVNAVLALNNDYDNAEQVNADLAKWTDTITLYNTINHSHVKYGYGRLDAFGRIYNRVLEHVINKEQVAESIAQARSQSGKRIVSNSEINKVLEGIDETIIGDEQFALIIKRLQSKEPGYPGLSLRELLAIRDIIFNEPDAPVSYPFLWDIAQSTYVQWNGLADNSGVGPLGRNTGEVIGVFGILDWQAKEPGFSLSSFITGQDNKKKTVDFKSSIDLTNLQRLESHLASLQSPQWPEDILGKIDRKKAEKGRLIYAQYCQSCHEVIDRSANDRLVVSKMSAVGAIGTDVAMANNSVSYKGKAGNFKNTYQNVGVGDVVIEEEAPVVQLLTSATKGVVATPDADKWFIRRWADWVYVLFMSFADNDIKASVKSGNYTPDTTQNPYNSLVAYKARSLNGIWATAPYLHNGSVPSLYDLLLPVQCPENAQPGDCRPKEFVVGSREFNPKKVGFKDSGYNGTQFTTVRVGDMNTGHEYAAGKTAQADGKTVLPALNEEERWALVEYLKTL